MIGCKHKEDIVDNNAKYYYTMNNQFLRYTDSFNVYANKDHSMIYTNHDSQKIYGKQVDRFFDSTSKYYDLMYPNREEHLNRIYDTLYAHRKHRVQK